MNKIAASIICLFFITGAAFAQSATPAEPKPYIEVTGISEQEIVPDEIYINIIIRERYSGRDKLTIEIQEDSLKAALTRAGIDISNLSLANANAGYVSVKWTKKDVMAKKDYRLKVSTATAVGLVFRQLDELDISDAWISKVNHSRIDSLNKANRILAIKAAKEKADYLLSAIGEKTGKPLVVEERAAYNQSAIANNLNVRGSRGDSEEYYVDGTASGKKEEVQFQKIKLQSSIYVKFLIN